MTAYNQSARILVVKYINHLWCSQLQLLVKIRWAWLYLISFSLICLCWKTFKQKSHRIFVLKIMYHEKTGPPYKTSTWSSFLRQNISCSWCHWHALCELPKCSALWSTPDTPWTTMAASHNYNVEFLKSKIHKKASITDGYSFVRYVCCKLHFSVKLGSVWCGLVKLPPHPTPSVLKCVW